MGKETLFFLVYGITWFIVPGPAGRWCLVELFWADDGQTIPPHHSIAKYLKNLKLMSRTGTFILGHCVNYLKTKASIHYYFFGFGGYLSTTAKKLVSSYTIFKVQHYTHKIQHLNSATYSEITTFSCNQTKHTIKVGSWCNFFLRDLLRNCNFFHENCHFSVFFSQFWDIFS